MDVYAKGENLIEAISAISVYDDPEYQRIIRELLSLGLAPTGNKYVDMAKLSEVKLKVQTKNNQKFSELDNKKTEDAETQKLEDEKLGATILGDINKILLGIK